MTTKNEIVAIAFEELGMAEYVFDATPEELQGALRRLQTMATEWDGIGIRAGYRIEGDLMAESGLPDTAINAYAINLAVRMGPGYGKILSPESKANAYAAKTALMTSLRQRPEVPYPRRLPIGTGNKRDVLDRQYFGPDENTVPGLNDGPLEYN